MSQRIQARTVSLAINLAPAADTRHPPVQIGFDILHQVRQLQRAVGELEPAAIAVELQHRGFGR